MEKWPDGGKGGFLKMSVSSTRELHFEGPGGPEAVEKGALEGLQKSMSLKMKKKWKNEAKKGPRGGQKSSKNEHEKGCKKK